MDESTYGKTPAIFPANPEYRPFNTIFPPPRAAYIIKVKNNLGTKVQHFLFSKQLKLNPNEEMNFV